MSQDYQTNNKHEPNPHFFDATSGVKAYKSPDAAFAAALHVSHRNATVATRVPKLKLSSYVLIGLVLLGALQSILLSSVIVGVAGAADLSKGLMAPLTIVTWIGGIVVACILLRTKNVVLARRIVGAVCLLFVYWIIVAFIHIDIIGAAINGFLLWWAYDLYRSLDGLSYEP